MRYWRYGTEQSAGVLTTFAGATSRRIEMRRSESFRCLLIRVVYDFVVVSLISKPP